MLLRRKINNDARIVDRVPVKHKHFSDLYFTAPACGLVRGVVVGESLFELQGDTLTHHPDGIDGVDKCLGVGAEKITCSFVNHQ